MNDPEAANSRGAESRDADGGQSRCIELGARYIESLESSSLAASVPTMNPELMNPELMNPELMNPELMNPELARHREECESCAAEWAELHEFEERFAGHLTDPASIPAEVRAAYVGAQRRAQSLLEHSSDHSSLAGAARPGQSRRSTVENSTFESSTVERAPLERAPAPRGVSRFAAAIVLSLTVGLLASFLGSETERLADGRLSLIRIERSGEGTLAPGEPFRLRATAVRDGYLAIVVSDGESIDLLFPHPDPSSEDGFSTLGAPGYAITAGESWEIPNPVFGEFTASATPGRETYFLFVRPLSGGVSAESIESTLRAHFDASLASVQSLDLFERWLTGRYASVDRVELTVE